MTNLIGDDLPGAFSPHPDLPPLTVAQLEQYHQRFLERGDTATARVLARLAASKAASKLWREIRVRRRGEYVHPAGLASLWRYPDLQPELKKLLSNYLKRQPNGIKWREIRKWLDSGARHEFWERQRIVAKLLAMLAERVTRSDAGKLVGIARQVQTQRNSEALLRHLRKKHYPDYAAVFTKPPRDLEHNLNRGWTRVENELILAVYGPLSRPVGSLGYRIVADLVGAALDREIDWARVRYVINPSKKKRRRKSLAK
jgi:hypothetical protein